jgi:hypothetical protein
MANLRNAGVVGGGRGAMGTPRPTGMTSKPRGVHKADSTHKEYVKTLTKELKTGEKRTKALIKANKNNPKSYNPKESTKSKLYLKKETALRNKRVRLEMTSSVRKQQPSISRSVRNKMHRKRGK